MKTTINSENTFKLASHFFFVGFNIINYFGNVSLTITIFFLFMFRFHFFFFASAVFIYFSFLMKNLNVCVNKIFTFLCRSSLIKKWKRKIKCNNNNNTREQKLLYISLFLTLNEFLLLFTWFIR
jgi:hypothetical protein